MMQREYSRKVTKELLSIPEEEVIIRINYTIHGNLEILTSLSGKEDDFEGGINGEKQSRETERIRTE